MILEVLVFMIAPAYLIFKISRMYIPTAFENPGKMRVQAGFLITADLFSKASRFFRVNDEVVAFRKFLDSALKHLPKFMPTNDIQIIDKMIDQVPIRIYKPIDLNDQSTCPALIFYHGGGFIFDKLDSYNNYLNQIAKKTKFIVISVIYRKAPEYAYPIPIDDCIATTKYIFKNAQSEFKIDPNRIVLAGDSAGGCAVAVVTQTLLKEKQYRPKLQVFIYPWTQMYNYRLPSMIEYGEKHMLTTLIPAKLALAYLGRTNQSKSIVKCLNQNLHMHLLDNETKLKYDSYVNIDLVRDEYKKGKPYYENYKKNNSVLKKLEHTSVLNHDLEFRKDVLKLFNPKFSPLLADDVDLRNMPKAYFIILEWDLIKDEGLIYAERLRLNGCDVQIDLYEDGFHGIAPSITDDILGFDIARKIFNNMIEKIITSV